MSQSSRINALLDEVPTPMRPVVGSVLRKLAHDVNGLIATFVMEAHSLGRRVQDLQNTEDQNVARARKRMAVSVDNIRDAATNATEYIKRLGAVAGEWDKPERQQP